MKLLQMTASVIAAALLAAPLLAVAEHQQLPLATLAADTAPADNTPRPAIAIIIDDLGNQRLPGLRAINLTGPVACAIMPHTAHATFLAEQAYAAGKLVMLHLPMQPIEMQRIAGPGEISLENDRADLVRILADDIRSVPHVAGVNNHMGSLITQHPGHMRWLMDELASRGNLFFVDSYTTPSSVAYDLALEAGVPAARRSVFLDNDESPVAVERQFALLKQSARLHGYAIGIGHPYAVTLAYLERALPLLAAEGFELVPVTRIIDLQRTAVAVNAPLIAATVDNSQIVQP